MNLYECEGKELFAKYGIGVPRGVLVRRGDDVAALYTSLGIKEVAVKAQVLSGKRGKGGGIKFCSDAASVTAAVSELFSTLLRDQYVASVRIEEKLAIAEEYYVSIVYDTNKKQPVLIYSAKGGMDIDAVPQGDIIRVPLDVRDLFLPDVEELPAALLGIAQKLWLCFIKDDCRLVEINPVVKTTEGAWIAADAKVALDPDAFYRHEEWERFEPRSMMGRLPTEREIAAKKIDEGEKYYQGTAGKYIEMDGDIAVIFGGGGASIANMDALLSVGLKPANYTEYSGNPPREKVYALTKLVLSKPGIRAFWLCGSVANFTNMEETFQGIADAFDEIKPTFPIVVRRSGPYEKEGLALLRACAKRNNLDMISFGKEISMSESVRLLANTLSKS